MKKAQVMAAVSVRVRKAKAAEKRTRVKVLRDQGYTAPQIGEILKAEGITVKVRTLYEDFKHIKRETETHRARAQAAEKQKRVLSTVRIYQNQELNVPQVVEILNSQGFNIDPQVVFHDFATLKREIEIAIDTEIHNNP